MTKADNPQYYEHCKEVVFAVFRAEEAAAEKHNIRERAKNRTITPEEYVELVVDELISKTQPEEIDY